MAMADDDHHSTAFHSSPPTRWGSSPHIYPHSHHGTPAQEFTGFTFAGPSPPQQMPIESHTFHGGAVQQRPMHQHLQPLIMPQWPSMLSSQSQPAYVHSYPPPVQPALHTSMNQVPTPVSAGSTKSASTPRKTLTDLDRKRMCQYAEEHPNSKQTEIGAIFGVERSTVSKVLRQKEKYLFQDDGKNSPVKRAKGRSPDVERALAVWAKNQVKKGMPLSDDLIRDKARAFAATTASPDNHVALSASWIEKFKLKNNLMNARSRKGSLAPDDADASSTSMASHTPTATSPISPTTMGPPSPIELNSAQSQDSLKNESPECFGDFNNNRHVPFHSQSTASLHSAFTDAAPTSFSPVPLSPTSPFFTPDSGTAPSPFVSSSSGRPILPATANSNNSHRPRSQTFPLLDQYMMSSGEATTPKHATSSVLDSPMEESLDALHSMDARVQELDGRSHTISPSETMRPPPLPAHVQQHRNHIHQQSHSDMILQHEDLSASSLSNSGLHISHASPTSPEDARRALEVVLSFFAQQPSGYLDLQESVTIGKLMEKLKLQSRGSS